MAPWSRAITRRNPQKIVRDHGRLAAAPDLAAGADLLIHDAFLLAAELAAQARFGHAAAEYAAELGRRAGARQVVLAHHRPDRTDDQLDQVAELFAAASPPVTVGAEGGTLDL